MAEEFDEIYQAVDQYYSKKIRDFGPIPSGVDWNSSSSQTLRFKQLLKVAEGKDHFSINDIGCGYGSLIDYLEGKDIRYQYQGLDLSKTMIEVADKLHKDNKRCKFYSDFSMLPHADYSIASGIFNVRAEFSDDYWRTYVLSTLKQIDSVSIQGFSFNLLTSYSDQEFMRPDLFYGDPLFYFDYCKTRFSKYVSLLHNYPLYEFTILVNKEV